MKKILFFLLLFCTSLQAQQLLYAPIKAGLAGTLFTGQGIGSVPSFSATPTLGIAGTTTGQLKLANATGSNVITLQAPASPSAYMLTLPTTAGTNTYTLTTDGSGNLSWTAPGAATMAIGSGVSSGTSGSILYVNASNQLAQDNANLFWNATNHQLFLGATTGLVTTSKEEILMNDNANTTNSDNLYLRHNASSNTPGAGFGNKILFYGQTTTTADQFIAQMNATWGTATHASRQGNISFTLGNSGGSSTVLELLDNTSTGIKFDNYGAGALSSSGSGVISSGTLSVANGGTGAATLTNHGVLLGQSTSAIVATAAGTAGQVLVSGGASADPSYKGTNTNQSVLGATNYSTASLTLVHVAMGGALTPATSGTVLIIATAQLGSSVKADGAHIELRYGTGTAPVQGAAVTGTATGVYAQFINYNITSAVNTDVPGTLCSVVTGLTVNTAYWFDIVAKAVTGGTAAIDSPQITIIELK